MVAQTQWFDAAYLATLVGELQTSMRRLLFDLCDDLERHYRRRAQALQLPLDYFRFVGSRLKREDFSTGKVVGWIEELNDLLYFIDLQQQFRQDRDRRAFVEQFALECQEKFFEHSYREELFPSGAPNAVGLDRRLERLCTRLARQVVQESLFLVPGLPCLWLARSRGAVKRSRGMVPCDLQGSFERAELPGRVYVGLEGAYLDPPASLRRRLARKGAGTSFQIKQQGIWLSIGKTSVPLWGEDQQPAGGWTFVPPHLLRPGLTLGPVLIYGKDLTPARLAVPPDGLADRINRAWDAIASAWPEGAKLLTRLTTRIVPLQARGVVSFSYRHRPGLSFINTFDRDRLDLIDDLIHENSHHHLNLLLRKFDMRRGDHNQEIFYSPWRRSLRPLHGILHATFTFTMGATLFERLSAWAEKGLSAVTLRTFGLGERDIRRARLRCLEEVESVRYSVQDLVWAAERKKWLSPSGRALVRALAERIAQVGRRSGSFRDVVKRSRQGAALRRHGRELELARMTYERIRG
ncbi:MAG: hypothetical protein EPO61_10770 [Nitrospirae bacterium]|nr:MAG: hypothetical protein EPO61_10770 [Nitrospirota bacterium]